MVSPDAFAMLMVIIELFYYVEHIIMIFQLGLYENSILLILKTTSIVFSEDRKFNLKMNSYPRLCRALITISNNNQLQPTTEIANNNSNNNKKQQKQPTTNNQQPTTTTNQQPTTNNQQQWQQPTQHHRTWIVLQKFIVITMCSCS
ncbi:hypothetical protein ACTA71_007903 [Dictyostelium dimigraforme]